jgi:hypothetical protein
MAILQLYVKWVESASGNEYNKLYQLFKMNASPNKKAPQRTLRGAILF